jgi:hypothetical protein
VYGRVFRTIAVVSGTAKTARSPENRIDRVLDEHRAKWTACRSMTVAEFSCAFSLRANPEKGAAIALAVGIIFFYRPAILTMTFLAA